MHRGREIRMNDNKHFIRSKMMNDIFKVLKKKQSIVRLNSISRRKSSKNEN